LEFVGWELIGVICQAFVDGIGLNALEECNRILKVIAEVREVKLLFWVLNFLDWRHQNMKVY